MAGELGLNVNQYLCEYSYVAAIQATTLKEHPTRRIVPGDTKIDFTR